MGFELPLAAFLDVLIGTILTLFFLVAFLMTVIILLQEGKGGGLAGAFGGAGAETFGVKAGTVNKLTAWFATGFLGLALMHAGFSAAANRRNVDDTEVDIDNLVDDETKGGDAKDGDGKDDAKDKKDDSTPPAKDGATPPAKDDDTSKDDAPKKEDDAGSKDEDAKDEDNG